MHKIRNLPKFVLFMVAAAILCSAGSASAFERPRPGGDTLRETYQRNIAKLATNSFGLPLFLESFEQDYLTFKTKERMHRMRLRTAAR